jgi:class 3 adenylate cyclase
MDPYTPGPGDLPSPFGPYQILRRLGGGGMGTVYQARDPALDRLVALKVPRLEHPAYAQLKQRFEQEARAAACLYHPNLCPVYQVGEVDGVPYLTMPFLDGTPLSACLAGYAGRPRAAAALAETLGRALAVAHAKGVVHRDLKPDNILLDGRGQPVVVDFGLALRLDAADPRLTRDGTVMGTPAYMAPEQHAGDADALGPACDVYSLGVILYELLAGRPPFAGPSDRLLTQKRQAAFPPLVQCRPGLAPALDDVCRTALAPAPADRFATMTAFAEALAEFLKDRAEAPVVPTPGGGEAPRSHLTPYPSDPLIIDEVLRLLRQLGWEAGMTRLRERILVTEDARQRAALQMLAGWLATERGGHPEGVEFFAAARASPDLKAWALVGEAFAAYRDSQFQRAEELLDAAARLGHPEDAVLRATLAHYRGALLYKQGAADRALEHLDRALTGFGPDHLGTGRVLDTLGMVYASSRNDFPTAFLFYQRSLDVKRRLEDLPGLALTCGQLGRLCLDWGLLDRAEEYFREDLRLCERISDRRGEAQMHNHLGQVFLGRGKARQALTYLNESVRQNEVGGWAVGEGYARKDRARAWLEAGKPDDAEADARRAEELFSSKGFQEGVYHARRARALARAARGEYAEAERLLRPAAAYFDDAGDLAEAARTYLELARLRQAGGGETGLPLEALRSALDRAERSRRDGLVGAIEEELGEVDEVELYQRLYRRARGRGIREEAGPLGDGTGEKATVLFLDLRNYSGYALKEDAAVVLRTLNQIYAELAAVLERHEVIVNQYLGDGFMALVRERDHARRAVAGGLELLRVLEQFNRPRRVLGLPVLQARIGVSTGQVVLGNIGTHRKMDFTAVGPTTNQAARLQAEAREDAVCVSEGTRDGLGDEFAFHDPAGRVVKLKGMGEARVWDVVGRRRV